MDLDAIKPAFLRISAASRFNTIKLVSFLRIGRFPFFKGCSSASGSLSSSPSSLQPLSSYFRSAHSTLVSALTSSFLSLSSSFSSRLQNLILYPSLSENPPETSILKFSRRYSDWLILSRGGSRLYSLVLNSWCPLFCPPLIMIWFASDLLHISDLNISPCLALRLKVIHREDVDLAFVLCTFELVPSLQSCDSFPNNLAACPRVAHLHDQSALFDISGMDRKTL